MTGVSETPAAELRSEAPSATPKKRSRWRRWGCGCAVVSPLRYRREGDGCALYSIGIDRRDDDGADEFDRDIVFRQ